MLKTACIHPEIIHTLSLCGHGDRVLIADGNYPLSAQSGTAHKVHLGLTAGVPTVTQVLQVLGEAINIESATVMMPTEKNEPEIFEELRNLLGRAELNYLHRQEFYDECCKSGVRLAIATGEQRTFANILITVGVAT